MTTPSPDIPRPDFAISVRGYDRGQVDAYFGRVVSWLADAENRAMTSEHAREALAREVANLRTTVAMLEERTGVPAPQSMSAFSERMERIMESALQAAQELRTEAEQEAGERRESASKEAERLAAEAKDEAERIVEEARRAKQEMTQRIEGLRVLRAETVETLLDLQRRIEAVVGDVEPGLDDGEMWDGADAEPRDADSGDADSGDGDEDTGKVDEQESAKVVEDTAEVEKQQARKTEDEGAADAADDLTLTDGVIVTAAPTIVQPAVAPRSAGRTVSGGRRRSA